MTFARQHLGGQTDRFGEVSGDFRQGRKKEVSETMAAQFAVAAKPITKKTRQQLESSESAIMQLRMSPGGSICNSSRRRPELPPSSETVTIAERLSIQISSSV